MSKKSDILSRVIDDTKNNKIIWHTQSSPSGIIRWGGTLYLTKTKFISFFLSYYKNENTFNLLKLFFVDDAKKWRTTMIEIEDSMFTFKVNNLLVDLINLVEKKNSNYEVGPPRLKSLWDEEEEVVY